MRQICNQWAQEYSDKIELHVMTVSVSCLSS